MASLIDRDVLLKEYDKLPVQKVDWVDCGDAYRTRPLVDLARVHNMIEDAPSITEAEIRTKAISEFAEQIKAEIANCSWQFSRLEAETIDKMAKELKGE